MVPGVLLRSSIVEVTGDSTSTIALYPESQVKDTLFFDRAIYRFRTVKRNKIIIFQPSEYLQKQCFSQSQYIRRILALSSETLEISQGQIIINNKPFTDSTIKISRVGFVR